MKIRAAESTGINVPQFIVEAENDSDKVILKMFMSPKWDHRDWKFSIHGFSYCNGGYSNFNFGWQKPGPYKYKGERTQAFRAIIKSVIYFIKCL